MAVVCLTGFSSARRMFEQQLMNMSRTLHAGQCLVMLSFWFYVLRNALHHPGKMNWVGTFPFQLPYRNPELIRDYSDITCFFTHFESFINDVQNNEFLYISLTSVFSSFDTVACSDLIHHFTFSQTLNISSSSNSI
jgi:hypothetical protein